MGRQINVVCREIEGGVRIVGTSGFSAERVILLCHTIRGVVEHKVLKQVSKPRFAIYLIV